MAKPSTDPLPTENAPTPVLLNESAGMRAGGIGDRLSEAFRRRGLSAEVVAVEPGELEPAIREAASAGERVVAVSGGDGTLMAAARVLAGGDAVLAPIPTGTMNHFSRRLGIEGIDAALDALADGTAEEVPLGVVNDQLFLNTATIGLYAEVVRRRERLRPWLTKWPAALVSFAEIFARLARFEVVLELEGGERLTRRTALLWVGMGWGSFPRVHHAAERRSEPDLEIVILRPTSRIAMMAFLPRFLVHVVRANRPVSDPALEVIHARSILIQSRHRLGVTLDGEVMKMDTPLYIGVLDRALRVLHPPADPS